MSHTQAVYFRARRLPSIAVWQAAIERHGFDVKLEPTWDLAKNAGNVPIHYKGQETGFECSLEKVKLDELPEGVNADSAEMSVAFVSRGELSYAAAFVAAATLAKVTSGTLFDWECGDAFSPNEALELARDEYEDPRQES
jgi:hypothetical protein